MSKYISSLNILRRTTAFFMLFALIFNTTNAATWYVDYNDDVDPDTCVAGESDDDDDCTFD